ncbi:LpqB family beta-propeller domain-containing protein, partial [Nocardioides sp.]|uniref:LpqB family beta-propeller domain-containing protein n=1 Tax=Nocardioides sp. TaxID=35761 RepID=UPI0027337BDF
GVLAQTDAEGRFRVEGLSGGSYRVTAKKDGLGSATLDGAKPDGTTEVRIRLSEANHLDERGAWIGPLPAVETTLRLPMVQEGGEWRIDEVPDALIVPESWFETHFRQVSLYFFDPTGQVLVPEPVFVPRGEQLATTLTRGLLLGPGDRLRGVSRTFFPADATLELSVPVTASGAAEIALQGELTQPSPQATTLMLAQLSWTLRQEPTIRSIRLSIGGEPVTPPGSATEFRVGGGEEFDPAVAGASTRLFGLRGGRAVEASAGAEERVGGPLGRRGARLRDLAVNLQGTAVAGVRRDGRSVVRAPTDDGGGPEQEVGLGQDFLKPSWDFADRLWLVDRTAAGARVSLVVGSEARRVRVPGVTGRDVSRFLVSRDGSRLVAVVAGESGDRVVVSRIRSDDLGRVRGATRALPVARDSADPLQIRDIAWLTPSSLLILERVTDDLAELTTVPVDGSHGSVASENASDLVREPAVGLVTSPVEAGAHYLLTDDAVVDLSATERALVAVDPRVTALTFPG